MTRTLARLMTGGAAMAVMAVAACGRNEPADAAASPADGVEIVEADPGAVMPERGREQGPEEGDGAEGEQMAELAPPAETPAPAPAPADTADRPLTLDLGSENVNITATLPQAAADDAALYERLRAEAEGEAEEARTVAAEDAAFRAQDDLPFMQHELEIAWAPTFANDRVLSLLKTSYVFQGGAHPNMYFDSLNWRRDTHAAFTVSDMLGADAWAAISPVAEQALMAQKREKLGDGLTDEQYWREDVIYATGPAPENFELFTLLPSASDASKAGGLTLHYPPYAVGAYVEGDYYAVIPQSVFSQYAKADYADLFAGEPAAN